MNNGNDTSNTDSEAIYRTPTSETGFSVAGDSLAAYVGPKNADYYARQFERFKSGQGSVSWNWPAFFVSAVWLLYRKMWLNAFIYWIVLPVGLAFLAALVANVGGTTASTLFYYSSYFLIAFVLLPMFANRLYFQHAQSKVDKVASITSSTNQQSVELARIGGTSNVILVVLPVFLIALIGILAAIAIPAYQDYTIRAQVAEGLNLAGGAKAAVTARYLETEQFAEDNESVGIAEASRISGNYVSSVAVVDGEIVITYGKQAHQLLSGHTIVLLPDASQHSVSWTCSSQTIQPKHLPAMCR